MSRFGSVVLSAVWLVGGLAVARADGGDAAVGRKKAVQCAVCHGLDGKAKLAEAPNLAGQNPVYIVSSLAAFKAGSRKNELMSVVAPNLSDQDMEDLAAYYSGLGCGTATK